MRTVQFIIADPVQINADIGHMVAHAFPLVIRTGHLGCLACVLLCALVRAIATVVRSVADIRLKDAPAVVATKIAGLTLAAANNCARVRFVRLILTVWRTVAMPRFRHTDPTCPTLKLLLVVACVRLQHGTAQFVRAVIAIGNPVALVRLVHALLEIGALELGRGAGLGRTALLVRVVEAVIVAVADPGLGNAVAGALAGELEVGARLLGAGVA